uniref:Uncharacterized protein n=1 Tax=Arundo donax TaxID=35708 RepID=A0A0A8YQU9_ARUDO
MFGHGLQALSKSLVHQFTRPKAWSCSNIGPLVPYLL